MTDFVAALRGSADPVIMEVKTRSADGVDLLRDRRPSDIVEGYRLAGAACLSVVTGRWFGGGTALIDEVVAAAEGLPVLWKDFVTRPSQLSEARDRGVSAVLLTVGILPAPMVAALVDRCCVLGLTPCVEITDHDELAAVPRPSEVMIAVNNKDIRRREAGPADLGRSRRLLASVRSTGARCRISASGIDGPVAAAELLELGYEGLLIGAGVLRTDEPGRFLDLVRAHRSVLRSQPRRVSMDHAVPVTPHAAPA